MLAGKHNVVHIVIVLHGASLNWITKSLEIKTERNMNFQWHKIFLVLYVLIYNNFVLIRNFKKLMLRWKNNHSEMMHQSFIWWPASGSGERRKKREWGHGLHDHSLAIVGPRMGMEVKFCSNELSIKMAARTADRLCSQELHIHINEN